jgi:hypothetical protein
MRTNVFIGIKIIALTEDSDLDATYVENLATWIVECGRSSNLNFHL